MPRFGQLVVGPAGSGKTNYCHAMQQHAQECLHRTVHVVNLDPANENMQYQPLSDIRSLVQLEDVMEDEDLHLGPNGGLVYCMRFLMDNVDWLQENVVDESVENDYFLFDCPGQIELFTHLDVMQRLVEFLVKQDFRICGVFLLDAHFLVHVSDYIAAMFMATSCMSSLQDLPFVCAMTRIDLLNESQKNDLEHLLDPDLDQLLEAGAPFTNSNPELRRLHEEMCSLMNNHRLVQFRPFDMSEEQTLGDIMVEIDLILQLEEELEPSERNREMTENVLLGPQQENGD